MEQPNVQEAFETLAGDSPMEMTILRDTAFRIFDGKKIRFVNLPSREKSPTHTFLIILDEKMSFWFFKKEGQWKFDGWEIGDYSQSWLEFSF